MPGTEIPEEKSFSLGGINVPVGWNNYTRNGKTRESFFSSSEKIVLVKYGNWKKDKKILIQPLFFDHPYIN